MAPITLISSVPTFITKEQLDAFQASTPASGDLSHDPVLHHVEKDCRITLEPAIDGFDALRISQGDVYVTDGALSFFDPSTSSGFSIPYPTISLHAISSQPVSTLPAASSNERVANGHPAVEMPCVYCQLDENEGADYDNLPEDELAETKELSIFPSTREAVQTIYAALSTCAALYPSTDASTGANGASNVFADSANDPDFAELLRQANEQNDGQEDRADVSGLTAAGRAQLERLDSLIQWNIPASTGTSNQELEADATEDAEEAQTDADVDVGNKRKR